MLRIKFRASLAQTPAIIAWPLVAWLLVASLCAALIGCNEQGKTAAAPAAAPAPAVRFDTLSARVKVGESFNSIAHNLDLPQEDKLQLLSAIKENFRFKLYAGLAYKVVSRNVDGRRSLQAFILDDRFSERKHVLSRGVATASAPAGSIASGEAGQTGGIAAASVTPVLPSAGSAGTGTAGSPSAVAAPQGKESAGNGPAAAAPQGTSALQGTAETSSSVSAADADPSHLSYRVVDIPIRVDTVVVAGSLTNNLYDAFVSLGETGALIQQVTKIFAWDLDFFKDPRAGDAFSLLVEKRYGEDGSFRGYGQVLSAKYTNRGHQFFGMLYNDGYYDESGRSLEKMLMRAPLNFVHVTSGFSAARLHPVLGVTRPHWGIDYAGPLNTKILAAGDGTVEYCKWVNGYGKTIKIRHNSVYNTYYGHLNGFVAGLGSGRRVKQGEVIGYMGKTGLATGVHLDYRVEYNGRYINPASLKMEAKQGVAKAEWNAFCDRRDHLLARMTPPEPKHLAAAPAVVPPGGPVKPL